MVNSLTSDTFQLPEASCLTVALLVRASTGCDWRTRIDPILGTRTLPSTTATRCEIRNVGGSRLRLLKRGNRARFAKKFVNARSRSRSVSGNACESAALSQAVSAAALSFGNSRFSTLVGMPVAVLRNTVSCGPGPNSRSTGEHRLESATVPLAQPWGASGTDKLCEASWALARLLVLVVRLTIASGATNRRHKIRIAPTCRQFCPQGRKFIAQQ